MSNKRSRTLFETVTQDANSNTSVGNAGKISSGGGKRKVIRRKRGTSLAFKIKQIMRNEAEKKEVLTNVTNQANATATFVTLVNGVAQGTTNVTRVANEVTHSYIEVSIGITNQLASLGSTYPDSGFGDYGFWSLVLDRQPNGAAPTFAEIYDNSAGSGAEGTDFRITTTNQDRFKILARNEWSVGCGSVLTAGNTGPAVQVTGAAPYHVKEFVNLAKLGAGNPMDQKANFSGTGATISSISSGAIYFVWASALSSNSTLTQLSGQIKYRFVDI